MVVTQKIIHIKPGMGPQTVLCFPKEGHVRQGHFPSDLIVNFKQLPHEKFTRQGHDLILEHKISLKDSLNAGPIHF